ncbi:hypothetical protein AAG570_000848 [Ranatra chinensis]|uniref:RNA-directed DNA polymerase n=1 Tax=Ranatra chinensis TaxID=642074 RepID=A0ABD0YYK3_9HEMI
MEMQAPTQRTVDVNTVSGLALTAILNMPEFTGDPERLTDFLEAPSAAGAHLRSVNALLPPEVVNNIYGILIRKISHQVRAVRHYWEYGEAMEGDMEEAGTASEVCGQANENEESTRGDTQCVHAPRRPGIPPDEGPDGGRGGHSQIGVIEELLRKAVLSEMPEKIRRLLKALSNANFGVLLAQVDEEDDDYQAAKEDAATDRRMSGATSASPPDPSTKGQPKGSPECPSWGCKVLVDTGSTSTLIKEGVIRTQGWGSRVLPCECLATTVSGPTPLRGEIVLPLSGLSGKNRTVVAHVMDWSSNEYEAILGTDALKSVKDRFIMNALTDVLEKEVRNLLAQGIIRKSVSPYCSPLWVVPKTPDAQGNPRYRVVVDFKELNRQFRIKTDHNPLVWVEGLRETSARITRWKERLAPYAFQITHTKGMDNVVADSLSRMVNAIDSPSPTLYVHDEVEWDPGNFDLSLLGPPGGESPEPPGSGLLRRRVKEGPDLPAVLEAAARLSPVSRPESGRESAEQRRLLWEVGPLNDKARQLSVEIVQGPDVRTSCHRYGRTRTWTVTVGVRAINRDVQTAMDAILERGRRYYVHCQTDAGRRLMTVLYNTGIIARDSILRGVTYRLTTVEDVTEQDQLIKDYHVGKTNHRGIRETVVHLRRRYYWLGMERIVTEQLALCAVCARAKYVRIPEEPPQMVSPTRKSLWRSWRLTWYSLTERYD